MEKAEQQDLNVGLSHQAFLLKHEDIKGVERSKVTESLTQQLIDEGLLGSYEYLCKYLNWDVDDLALTSMKETVEDALKALDEKIKDAEENLGETDVRDACLAKAKYLEKIGDREQAIEAFKITESKTPSVGSKIDLIFSQIRLAVFHHDWIAYKDDLQKAKQLCDEGGDWERKNKIKVYDALFQLIIRDFKKAADLFIDAIATFETCPLIIPELFPFSSCIFYAVLTAMISFDRVSLKKRVVDAPEILAVIEQIPNLKPFLNSLYDCNYGEFFQALQLISGQIHQDMYLYPHFRHYLREIRVVAYSQFLESYKSVTFKSMADAFQIGVDFLDKEVADFIVAGRLHAKVDKVSGVIETTRPDVRNALYQQTIKQGDLLLNRIQKLSKVIDLE